jgi:hypothetical protein
MRMHSGLAVMLAYTALVIVGSYGAYLAGLVIEKNWGPNVSLFTF